MLVLHGGGRNGKGTMIETMRDVVGSDYAAIAPTEMLLTSREGGIPNDLARLRGVRLVTASETAEGRRLDESKVKALTGGDSVTARFMRGEWFDFRPVFTIWLSTNHRPAIRGTDDGIWSRLRLIPFNVRFYRPDEPHPPDLPADRIADLDLPKKLLAEGSGILRWMVEGATEWRRRGSLDTPAIVRAATEKYRASEDLLGEFIAERCVIEDNAEIPSKDLYAAYVAWSNDTKPMSESTFGKRITELGIDSALLGSGRNRYRARIGIRLRTEFDDVQD
jgi:putative DNA primase/helicase